MGTIFKIVRQAEAECLREFFCRQNVIGGGEVAVPQIEGDPFLKRFKRLSLFEYWQSLLPTP